MSSSMAGLGAQTTSGSGADAGDELDEDGLPMPDQEVDRVMADAAKEEEKHDAAALKGSTRAGAKLETTTAADLVRLATQKSAEIDNAGDDDMDQQVVDAPSKKPMHVSVYDAAAYDALDQNLATPADIPSGVDDLNRYYNILPNKETRVMLDQVPGTDATTTYVNANWVHSWDGKNKKAYIASQGPMQTPRNVADFWRMIWQHGVGAILMVTGITERGIEKCARYWVSQHPATTRWHATTPDSCLAPLSTAGLVHTGSRATYGVRRAACGMSLPVRRKPWSPRTNPRHCHMWIRFALWSGVQYLSAAMLVQRTRAGW